MNLRSLLALLPLAASLAAASESAAPACECEKAAPAAESAPAAASIATTTAAPETPRGHPLKGVVVSVLPDKSALLVKHEEIPGVMKAMTMLLKVDAATLAAARQDEAITATLVKKADGWWLEDLKATVPAR